MKVIIRKIKPLRMGYLRHVGPYEETRETWIDLMALLSADEQFTGVPCSSVSGTMIPKGDPGGGASL